MAKAIPANSIDEAPVAPEVIAPVVPSEGILFEGVESGTSYTLPNGTLVQNF